MIINGNKYNLPVFGGMQGGYFRDVPAILNRRSEPLDPSGESEGGKPFSKGGKKAGSGLAGTDDKGENPLWGNYFNRIDIYA